jgi:hypothetical protein
MVFLRDLFSFGTLALAPRSRGRDHCRFTQPGSASTRFTHACTAG